MLCLTRWSMLELIRKTITIFNVFIQYNMTISHAFLVVWLVIRPIFLTFMVYGFKATWMKDTPCHLWPQVGAVHARDNLFVSHVTDAPTATILDGSQRVSKLTDNRQTLILVDKKEQMAYREEHEQFGHYKQQLIIMWNALKISLNSHSGYQAVFLVFGYWWNRLYLYIFVLCYMLFLPFHKVFLTDVTNTPIYSPEYMVVINTL